MQFPTITVEQAFELAKGLRQTGRLEAARSMCGSILVANPHHSRTLHLLAALVGQAGHHEEAARLIARAIPGSPAPAVCYYDLGVAHLFQGNPGEALAAFDQAIALQPEYAEGQAGRGKALHESARFSEAIAPLETAIRLRPDYAEPHFVLGAILMLLGRYDAGWSYLEWRGACADFRRLSKIQAVPEWRGEPVPGKTILVRAEQGFGDTMHFLRYLPLAVEKSQGGRIVFECQPELCELIGAAPFPGVEVVPRGSPLVAQYQALLLSLPLILGQHAPWPMTQAYLHADATLRAGWRDRLPRTGRRVGLVWAGDPTHARDLQRSLRGDALAPLLSVPGVAFYSLQMNRREPLPAHVTDAAPDLPHFAATAALMSELDLIITVDTAAAHLAGALGRPVWTLLPFVPDWRWGLESESTPWYPTMRLFRQKTAGDWEEVIERVRAELQVWAGG